VPVLEAQNSPEEQHRVSQQDSACVDQRAEDQAYSRLLRFGCESALMQLQAGTRVSECNSQDVSECTTLESRPRIPVLEEKLAETSYH
jgi:hypothetical protein